MPGPYIRARSNKIFAIIIQLYPARRSMAGKASGTPLHLATHSSASASPAGAIFPHSPAGSGSSAGPRRSFMPSQPSCR